MSDLILVFIVYPLLTVFGLFLLAFAGVHLFFSLQRRADRRQQAEYERQEWEIHLGKDRATLLRGAKSASASSDDLLRGATLVPPLETDSLLRVPKTTREN